MPKKSRRTTRVLRYLSSRRARAPRNGNTGYLRGNIANSATIRYRPPTRQPFMTLSAEADAHIYVSPDSGHYFSYKIESDDFHSGSVFPFDITGWMQSTVYNQISPFLYLTSAYRVTALSIELIPVLKSTSIAGGPLFLKYQFHGATSAPTPLQMRTVEPIDMLLPTQHKSVKVKMPSKTGTYQAQVDSGEYIKITNDWQPLNPEMTASDLNMKLGVFCLYYDQQPCLPTIDTDVTEIPVFRIHFRVTVQLNGTPTLDEVTKKTNLIGRIASNGRRILKKHGPTIVKYGTAAVKGLLGA